MVQIEDALITGVLREKVGVELAAMEPPTWLGWAWHTVLSQCPWMTITKLTFSNNLGRNPRLSTIWIMEGIFRIIASFACHKINGSYLVSVIEKKSSRKNVQYVGPVTEPRVLRYYTCLHIEVGLLALEQVVTSTLIPEFIWEICRRWSIELEMIRFY